MKTRKISQGLSISLIFVLLSISLIGCTEEENPVNPVLQLETPEFSPEPGSFTEEQSVAIVCSTAEAAIHYTLDGSEPTQESPSYGGPIEITTSSQLRARAWCEDWNPSPVQDGFYTIELTDALAVSEPGAETAWQAGQQDVAVIWSGGSEGPVDIFLDKAGQQVAVIVRGLFNSGSFAGFDVPETLVAGDDYRVRMVQGEETAHGVDFSILDRPQVSAPVFTPEPGVYTEALEVTLSCSETGAIIRYTTDGSDPTPASTGYTEPIPVAASATLRARSYHEDFSPSQITTASYNIALIPDLVVTEPTAGTVWQLGQDDASIHWTGGDAGDVQIHLLRSGGRGGHHCLCREQYRCV
jgi:hypothetical protein